MENDEQSEYLTLKYDIENNHITNPDKIRRYNELKVKLEERKKEHLKKQEEDRKLELLKEQLLKAKLEEREKERLEVEQLKKQLFRTNDFKPLDNTSNGYYLGEYYHAYHSNYNSNCSILRIKRLEDAAIAKEIDSLHEKLGNLDSFTVCVVPSSKCEVVSGTKKVIDGLLLKNRGVDGTNCIKRVKEIPQKHKNPGSSISSEEMKHSLSINNIELIKGKNILLFDDISTSGKTLCVVEEMLLSAGAKRVISIALRKTFK